MTTPEDPEREPSSERVDLTKDEQGGDAPFDPYRFGKPDHPIPAEYAPPGYTGPVIPTAPPPPVGWGTPPPGANQVNPFSNPPGTPYAPYGADPGAHPPAGPYPPPPGQYPPPYGPPPGYYAPTPPQYGYRPQPRAGHGKALTALLLGIGSILFCWLIFFDVVLIIPGVIFAVIAMGETKASGGSGRGMALAGLVCSIVGAVLATLLTVLILHAANQCGGFSNNNTSGFDQCVRDNFF